MYSLNKTIRTISLIGAFAFVTLSPTARAVDPPPDGGYPNNDATGGVSSDHEKKIAIIVNASFAGSEAGLYTITADGTGRKKLLRIPASPHSGGPPKWSPDNERIAFDAEFGGNDEIYLINKDGTGLQQLTFDPAEDRDPAWSPDGARIVFSSNRSGGHDLFVMNADGSAVVNLTNSPTSDEFQPDWSPDGSQIVFDSYAQGSGTQDVWIMNADGSSQTDLTPNTIAHFDGAARWSPDGTKIAFHSTRTGDIDIFVMNPDGSGVTDLTNNPASELSPTWSLGGSKLAFSSLRSGTSGVYSMNADGTDQKAILLTNTQDALWLGAQRR